MYDLHVAHGMEASVALAVEILMRLIMGCPPGPCCRGHMVYGVGVYCLHVVQIAP